MSRTVRKVDSRPRGNDSLCTPRSSHGVTPTMRWLFSALILATITTQPTCASWRFGDSPLWEPNREMSQPAHALLARESVWVQRAIDYHMAMDQCASLRVRADNARERLESARRAGNEEGICHQTRTLDWLTREITEIQESNEPYIQELKALEVGDLFRDIQ